MSTLYTLWAQLPNDDGAWMIAAEHEWTWEGDPDAAEARFKLARETNEREGHLVREVWLKFDDALVQATFHVTEVPASVTVPPPETAA